MAQTMLESLSCVRIEPPSRFVQQPISSDMEERAIRFELERQACQSLRQVLQLKLQQRRSREELVNQGIMPPLKSSAAFHEQRRCLERARTEDYLKRKIRSRPERSELIRMHILQEASAEPLLQAKQLQLKRARLAIDLNDKISHRPGPMELIHKNILPVHSSIKQAFIETDFPKASTDNSSCDEDSVGSLSPEESGGQGSPLGLPSPCERQVGSMIPSPTQVTPPAPILPQIPNPSPSLTNGAASAQRLAAVSPIKPKSNSDRSAQKHKKPKDNKPKIKKLKYHQYIPPDQKGDKEPPPHLDSSYAMILQQQQLFLQLQILNQQQQQQNYNYHAILPAPSKAQSDQQTPSSSTSSSSSSATSTAAPSPPQPAAPPSATYSTPSVVNHLCSVSSGGSIPACLPPNLDEMKVAELKSELKLRSLPVSGTKNDLIERLRAFQELNGGVDSAPCGGALPSGDAADGSPETKPTAIDKLPTQQFQCHQPPPLIAEPGDGTTAAAVSPQQLLASAGAGSPKPPLSRTHSNCSLAAMTPEERSINCARPGEKMRSPFPVNQKQSAASQLSLSSKGEHLCSIPAPCQLPMKLASVPKHCPTPMAAPTAAATAPVMTVDKDRMLREKDKQIEELTRRLRQKQRLVEVLRMQLEQGRRPAGQATDSVVLVRVKQEPLEKPSGPLSPSSLSCDTHVSHVTVKQEASGTEEGVCGTTVRSPGARRSLQPSSQRPQEQILQNKTQQQTHVVLQQSALQLAQQQAIQKLLLQKQLNSQNPQQQQKQQQQQQVSQSHNQTPRNHQNLQQLSQQRKKKSHKQQLKLQRQQQQETLHCGSQQQSQQSKQQQHQIQLKQQILLKQQKSLLQQQMKQPEKIKPKQQHSPQVAQAYKQSGSTPSFPLDLLKSNSTPTLVTDSNGNHFLIALTSHIPQNRRTDMPEGKAANRETPQLQSTPANLPGSCPTQATRAANPSKQNTHVGFSKHTNSKVHNGRLQVSVDQPQQGAAQGLSAPPTPQPFFKELGNATCGKKSAAPSPQTDAQHDDGLIDIILQAGEISSSFQPAPDSSLDLMNPASSSPPPSPLGMLLSPPGPPSPKLAATPADFEEQDEEKMPPADSTSGRLEDFLESTTGKPLLGVEPGGLLTLIDDLHSQMLCTPSILDHPISPMDTFDVSVEGERGLNGMDWLDFTMGEEKGEESPALAPLAPQTPTSVFSTDFLDSYDLQIHWDSCL